jgi:ligand-binding sensor domain-containing protein
MLAYAHWMTSTLAARVTEAIHTSGRSVVQVATTCGVSVQSVYGWMSGKITSIDSENLAHLAESTRFEMLWLAIGKGQKTRNYPTNDFQTTVLSLMQGMPEPYQASVAQITDTIGKTAHPKTGT